MLLRSYVVRLLILLFYMEACKRNNTYKTLMYSCWRLCGQALLSA
jgi:hypothetical protein